MENTELLPVTTINDHSSETLHKSPEIFLLAAMTESIANADNKKISIEARDKVMKACVEMFPASEYVNLS